MIEFGIGMSIGLPVVVAMAAGIVAFRRRFGITHDMFNARMHSMLIGREFRK
jgi:hypothetical protein